MILQFNSCEIKQPFYLQQKHCLTIILMLFYSILSFAQGCIYDSLATAQLPLLEIDTFKSDLDELHLLNHPVVNTQGECNSCVAWALCYYGLSILENQQNNPFSPYIICQLTERCGTGMDVREGLAALKKYQNDESSFKHEIPRLKNSKPYCSSKSIDKQGDTLSMECLYQHNNNTRNNLDLFMKRVRQEIMDKRPIILVIRLDETVLASKGTQTINISNTLKETKKFHALCGIGYSYNESAKTGYIEVINSWGREWGIDGRARINYEDIEHIVTTAYSLGTLKQ